MGVLLAYPLIAVCWLMPPWLIFRSGKVSGWKQACWVGASLVSFLVPPVVVLIGIAVAVHVGGYQRDFKSMTLGTEAAAMSIANLVALVLPWVVYFVFKHRYRP